MKVTATGIINKTANYPLAWFYASYPTGTQPFHPVGDAYMSILLSGAGSTWGPSVASGTTGVGYAKIVATSTITGASRNFKTNEDSFGPYYCGAFYPTKCFRFSGSAGEFTIERQSAEMVLTVDSATVSPGATVIFSVRSTVDSVGGFEVPVQIDTAGWTPDPDSLGGVSTETSATAACSISGGDCSRQMVGSGTIRIVAHVNGKGYEGTSHVTVRSLGVHCGSPVTRGANTVCTVHGNGGTPAITSWRFTPQDTAIGAVIRSIDVSSPTWSGPMVATGEVKVQGTVDGHPASDGIASVTVNPRSGWSWRADTSVADAAPGAVDCNTSPSYATTNYGWAVASCATPHVLLTPNPTVGDHGFPFGKPSDGPNTGLWYVQPS